MADDDKRRACTDCKFFEGSDMSNTGACRNPSFRKFDVVLGWLPYDARSLRDSGRECGPFGKGFEKRDPIKPDTAAKMIAVVFAALVVACVLWAKVG